MPTYPLAQLAGTLRGARVGLAATPASAIGLQTTIEDVLLATSRTTALLALEHGWRGELQDGVVFDSYTDSSTGLPVFSFYGEKKCAPEAFYERIDVAVFCVQDVSHRAYTYKQSLAELLRGAARHGTRVVVVDRPTPLAHLGARGPLHKQFFPLPLPVVIPFTLGELARLLVRETDWPVDLEVLPLANWYRSDRWHCPKTPWHPPSPNLPALASAYAYLATGLLQASNLSEGRGTCKPFEYVGAPFLDAPALVEALRQTELPGVAWRSVHFTPAFGKYAGHVCPGVHLMVVDRRAFQPVATSLTLLKATARLFPDSFHVLDGLADWLDGVPRTVADFATLDPAPLLANWQAQAEVFTCDMQSCSLYRDTRKTPAS